MADFSAARVLMVAINMFTAGGAFAWDWSETHVFNPRWPPHAKFHNGQTMSLAVALVLLSAYLSLRPNATVERSRDSVWLAALVSSVYGTTGLTAIFYPGSDWQDPDFESHGRKGAQGIVFAAVTVAAWVAYAWEVRRLKSLEKVKAG